MKYNIQIMSKSECTIFTTKDLKEDYIIISINNSNDNTVLYINPHIKDILTLQFDDIEKQLEGNILMTIDQGKQIKEFIDKHKDITNIVVHCTAGISRSGAIGCCLARYLNDDDEYLLKTGKYIPNKHVYKIMCEVLGLKYSEELFRYKRSLRNGGKYKINKSDENYGFTLEDMFGGK